MADANISVINPKVLPLVVMVAHSWAQCGAASSAEGCVGQSLHPPGTTSSLAPHLPACAVGEQERSEASAAVTTSSALFIITCCLHTSSQVSIHPQGTQQGYVHRGETVAKGSSSPVPVGVGTKGCSVAASPFPKDEALPEPINMRSQVQMKGKIPWVLQGTQGQPGDTCATAGASLSHLHWVTG